MKTTGTVTFAANDAIRLGGPTGFVGRLADLKIFSPGTIEVFNPAICSSSASCTSHLGVSDPPLCLSATCAASCSVSGGGTNNACFDSGDSSCLGCASGNYFYDNLCQTCPNTMQGVSDYCACPANTFAYQEQCLSSCPATTFGSSGTCASCPEHCQTCASESSCQACQDGYSLVDSRCQIGTTSSSGSSSESGTSAGVIAGAIGGSVGGVVLVGLTALHLKKKALRRREREVSSSKASNVALPA